MVDIIGTILVGLVIAPYVLISICLWGAFITFIVGAVKEEMNKHE